MSQYLPHLIILISSVSVAITFAELSGIPDAIKRFVRPVWHIKTIKGDKLIRRIKPFDCHLCLSFWICLYLSYSELNMNLPQSFVMGCIAAVTSTGVMKVIR